MTLHVVFTIAGTDYALPVASVLQMESFTGATLVPGAPAHVAGIVTVRGVVVPVIDVRVRFGLPTTELTLDTRIIVTESAGRAVALRVDAAREVVHLDPAKDQPPPAVVSERASGYVRGVHALGSRLLLLVDLPRILGESSHEQPHSLLPAGPARHELPS